MIGMKMHGRYNGLGLMVGSIWKHLLQDLRDEAAVPGTPPAWIAPGAAALEAFMADRAEAWSKQAFPFGRWVCEWCQRKMRGKHAHQVIFTLYNHTLLC